MDFSSKIPSYNYEAVRSNYTPPLPAHTRPLRLQNGGNTYVKHVDVPASLLTAISFTVEGIGVYLNISGSVGFSIVKLKLPCVLIGCWDGSYARVGKQSENVPWTHSLSRCILWTEPWINNLIDWLTFFSIKRDQVCRWTTLVTEGYSLEDPAPRSSGEMA